MKEVNFKVVVGVLCSILVLSWGPSAFAQDSGEEADEEVKEHSTTRGDEAQRDSAEKSGVTNSDKKREEHLRDGFWISFGLGGSSVDLEGVSDRDGGAAVGLELGGTISPRFLLGFGLHAAAPESPGGDEFAVGTATLMARWYPSLNQGFYLLGGLGTGLIETDEEYEGGAVVLGLGYDIPIGESWQFTPSLISGGVGTDDLEASFINLTLGLTYH